MFKKGQIILVHGGCEFESIEQFNLELLEWEPELVKKKGWKDWLEAELGADWQIHRPQMPCKLNANYSSWKIWFEKYLALLDFSRPVVLIGHSLGGAFLLKFLSENKLEKIAEKAQTKKTENKNKSLASLPEELFVAGLFLVAPVIDNKGLTGRDKLNSFLFDLKDLPQLEAQVDVVKIFHSEDDAVVPFDHSVRLKSLLPNAELVELDGCGHINGEDFVELKEQINSLT